jgi:hypothetical protein
MQSHTRYLRVLDDSVCTPSQIALLYGNADLTHLALYGIARVAAEQCAVWVLDGGNSFDAYFVARLARSWSIAPEIVLSHIRLSRAFTCYQMSELITRRMDVAIKSFPSAAIVCLDLLETFYDEDVALTDAIRLVRTVSAHLSELAQRGNRILIMTREPRAGFRERMVLLDLLKASAHQVERVDEPATVDASRVAPTQPQLIFA